MPRPRRNRKLALFAYLVSVALLTTAPGTSSAHDACNRSGDYDSNFVTNPFIDQQKGGEDKIKLDVGATVNGLHCQIKISWTLRRWNKVEGGWNYDNGDQFDFYWYYGIGGGSYGFHPKFKVRSGYAYTSSMHVVALGHHNAHHRWDEDNRHSNRCQFYGAGDYFVEVGCSTLN
jgi:hypothetical protein